MSTINGKACVANGRNLLLDTDFNNLDLWYANQYWTKQPDKYNGLAVMQTTSNWSGISQYIKVKTGEVYTFSIYARYASGTGTSNIYWLLNVDPESGHTNALVSVANKRVNLSDSWQRISVTTTITADGYVRPRIERTDNNSNVLQIAGMKLETGTLATPLTPVPVDKVFSNGKQVYGRNLLIGSTDNVVHYTSIGGFTVWQSYVTKFNIGDMLNVSADITSNSGNTVLKVFLLSSTGTQTGYLEHHVSQGQTDHVFVSKTIPTGTTSILVKIDNSNLNGPGQADVCTISHQFANTGSIATDWTPAPEDVI